MKLQRLMVVLDQANRPQTALKRAERICNDLQTPIELQPVSFLHSSLVENSAVFGRREQRRIQKMLVERHKSWLQEMQRNHPGLPEVEMVWEHDIAKWVSENAGACDLVIKSAHGSKTTRSATDWALLANCPTNLLLVGHRRVRQPDVVLAAVDLSNKDVLHQKLNKQVLEASALMTGISNAKLHTAHAVEVPAPLLDLDVVSERKAQLTLQKNTQTLRAKLLKPFAVAKKNQHFPVGNIGQAMADCAKDIKADLLVVGARARPVKEALGLGNTAQRIVRKAPCDVLVLRLK